MTDAPAALIRSVTALSSVPLVPEVRLHLLLPSSPLWRATPEEADEQGLRMPFWAFAWPGGQALARWLIDHPSVVAGRRVLDVGSGGAIEAIAAMTSGARSALCVDIDPVASIAARLNAMANGVILETMTVDPLSVDAASFDCDVVLVGDLTFDVAITARLVPWLEAHHARGRTVLVGDAGRVALPDWFESVGSAMAPFDGNPDGSTSWAVQVRQPRSSARPR